MSRDDSSWSFAAGLFMGALTGAALASLFTPRSGAQNRETVRERGLVLKARVNEATTSARDSATSTATTLRGTATAAADRVTTTVQTVRERVGDVADQVSDRVSSITQRSQDAIDTAADKAQDAIDTAADKAQDAVADTSQQEVRRTSAKVYDNTRATANAVNDLADRAEAQVNTATDRTIEATEQAAGRAEQAIDATSDATLATNVGTVPGDVEVIDGASTLPSTTGTGSTLGGSLGATDTIDMIETDTPALDTSATSAALDTSIDTAVPAASDEGVTSPSDTLMFDTPYRSSTTNTPTQPLTQPLEADLSVVDTPTADDSLIQEAERDTNASNDADVGKLGRNQVGNRYRR